MLKIPDFTRFQIEYIKENANFTKREEKLFDLRNEEYSLEECAEKMDMSVSTVNRTIKKIKSKCERLDIRAE